MVFFLKKLSLKKYPSLSYPVDNPVDITRLDRRLNYQVQHPGFILQFFFNKQDVFGVILQRDRRFPLRMRWCFYRSCEASPRDYTVTIGEALQAPFEDGFFSIKFPAGLPYEFQGIEFSNK